MAENTQDLHCSFCSKHKDEVSRLIAGPGVYICDECIDSCYSLIQEQTNKEKKDQHRDWNYTPKELFNFLNEYVIGQSHAKKVLSVAVYNHYKRLKTDYVSNEVELDKSNILLIGPTGSGKTLLAQTLARFLDVPFAVADATTLTEAGYVGDDVENVIKSLLAKCDFDPNRAEQGIIFIDEIDKISRRSDSPSITRDVSGEGVQQAMLKLIEGTIASVPPQGGRKHPNQETIDVDTSKILFICGGAFDGLEKVIDRRVEEATGIGFASVVKQFQQFFAIEGVKLTIRKTALVAIAKLAVERKTGARGLRAILEDLLLDTMYEMPSTTTAKEVIIDRAVVEGKKQPIVMYLSEKKSNNIKKAS